MTGVIKATGFSISTRIATRAFPFSGCTSGVVITTYDIYFAAVGTWALTSICPTGHIVIAAQLPTLAGIGAGTIIWRSFAFIIEAADFSISAGIATRAVIVLQGTCHIVKAANFI